MKVITPLIVYFFVTGCAGTTANAPQASPNATAIAPAPTTATATAPAAAKPDSAVAIKHLKEHVKYPASRAVVLATCADTPEFSAEEKKWFADTLPERTYGSAEEVARALHL
jgi:hypothetical protein